jgi:hypothetical protein
MKKRLPLFCFDLAIPFVVSAVTAVQASIFADVWKDNA